MLKIEKKIRRQKVKHYLGDQEELDGQGIRHTCGNRREKDPLEDLVLDRNLILKLL